MSAVSTAIVSWPYDDVDLLAHLNHELERGGSHSRFVDVAERTVYKGATCNVALATFKNTAAHDVVDLLRRVANVHSFDSDLTLVLYDGDGSEPLKLTIWR